MNRIDTNTIIVSIIGSLVAGMLLDWWNKHKTN